MSEKLKKYQIDEDGCHIWTGAKDRDGYGRMRGTVDNIPWFRFAHRASYEHYIGPIPTPEEDPEHCQVLHHCDKPACIKKECFYLDDPDKNMKDRERRGRGVRPRLFGPANPNWKGPR